MVSNRQSLYVYFPNMILEDGDFLQGSHVYGMPAITGIAGWSQSLKLKINSDSMIVRDVQFAWGMKKAEVTRCRSIYLCLQEDDSHYGKSRITLNPKGVMEYDVLIKFDVDFDKIKELKEYIERNRFKLTNGNLCGGYFYQNSKVPQVEVFDNKDHVDAAINRWSPHYHWILDATRDLEHHQKSTCQNEGGHDALSAMADYLNSDITYGPDYFAKKPAVIGYYQLEEERCREGVRDSLIHAHTECILSVIRLVPRVARNHYQFNEIFWGFINEDKKWICRGSL